MSSAGKVVAFLATSLIRLDVPNRIERYQTMAKVIIEAAINGNAGKKSNPHIPYSPKEIADDAIASCKAGAALIHFHIIETCII